MLIILSTLNRVYNIEEKLTNIKKINTATKLAQVRTQSSKANYYDHSVGVSQK